MDNRLEQVERKIRRLASTSKEGILLAQLGALLTPGERTLMKNSRGGVKAFIDQMEGCLVEGENGGDLVRLVNFTGPIGEDVLSELGLYDTDPIGIDLDDEDFQRECARIESKITNLIRVNGSIKLGQLSLQLSEDERSIMKKRNKGVKLFVESMDGISVEGTSGHEVVRIVPTIAHRLPWRSAAASASTSNSMISGVSGVGGVASSSNVSDQYSHYANAFQTHKASSFASSHLSPSIPLSFASGLSNYSSSLTSSLSANAPVHTPSLSPSLANPPLAGLGTSLGALPALASSMNAAAPSASANANAPIATSLGALDIPSLQSGANTPFGWSSNIWRVDSSEAQVIATLAKCEDVCRQLRLEKLVAVDCQYNDDDSTATLVQVASKTGAYLIDILLCREAWRPLALLMSDANVVKVIHRCGTAVAALAECGIKLFSAVVDSQLAFAALHPKQKKVSLDQLLAICSDANGNANLSASSILSSSTQRDADSLNRRAVARDAWKNRPLSKECISDAAHNISLLLKIADMLLDQIAARNPALVDQVLTHSNARINLALGESQRVPLESPLEKIEHIDLLESIRVKCTNLAQLSAPPKQLGVSIEANLTALFSVLQEEHVAQLQQIENLSTQLSDVVLDAEKKLGIVLRSNSNSIRWIAPICSREHLERVSLLIRFVFFFFLVVVFSFFV
jgi:hypothetical protein